MVGRFIGSAVLQKVRPNMALGTVAIVAGLLVVTSMLSFSSLAVWSILLVGLFNSVMFPTIFTLGIAELGPMTGKGSGLLIAAIVGGAVIPGDRRPSGRPHRHSPRLYSPCTLLHLHRLLRIPGFEADAYGVAGLRRKIEEGPASARPLSLCTGCSAQAKRPYACPRIPSQGMAAIQSKQVTYASSDPPNCDVSNLDSGCSRMRVVSLLASATEIVCALGAGDTLVGRSHECDNPDWVRRLPACSEPAFDVMVSSAEIDAEVRRRIATGEPLYQIHGDRIRDLQPDLLITQAHCEVCAVTPGDLERSGSCAVSAKQIALSAFSLNDIFESIRQVALALDLQAQGEALVHREQQRLERVRERVASFAPPTVVMMEWTDPVFAMGNWGPELVEIANGRLVIGNKGEYSAAIPGEELRQADPEYLIVAPCGYTLERSLREQSVLERYPWWPELQAVRKRQRIFRGWQPVL